jgi:hypothetical protein
MVPKHLNVSNTFVTSEEPMKKVFVQILKSTANELTDYVCWPNDACLIRVNFIINTT